MPATEFTLKIVEFATAFVGLATATVELYKTGQQDADANLQIAGRRRKVRAGIVIASFVVILGIVVYSALSRSFLYASLELQDPVVFHHSGDYRIARVFPNKTKRHCLPCLPGEVEDMANRAECLDESLKYSVSHETRQI